MHYSPHSSDHHSTLCVQLEPRSILRLQVTNRLATLNLHTEAEVFGIPKDRLLFQAKLKDYYQHVEDLGTCRLMLDAPLCARALLKHPSIVTPPHDSRARYNAHTSAGDVLWAGVPIVTLPGELMVTRGASSLLLAGGGALTVARTFEDYEDLVRCPVANAARWPDLVSGDGAAHAAVCSSARQGCLKKLPDGVQLVSYAGRVGA